MNKQFKILTSAEKFDSWLLFGFIALLAFSVVIVGSASISIAERYKVSDFYFIMHHIYYIGISLFGIFLITLVPIKYIEKFSIYGALLGLILLTLVFVPGLARSVNGAYRWILLGPISIQPSEIAKLLLMIYTAGYLVRKKDKVKGELSGFTWPLVVLLAFDGLLLLEPDFGSIFIISTTVICLWFVGGIRLRYLLLLLGLGSILIVILVCSSSYRLHRIIGFLNPWSDQFDKGYQLVQSLIAFGRGGWFGTGLGNSVQKLWYLPEAYTDFIFAIIAEELGFIGAIIIIILLLLVIIRCFNIAQTAMLLKQYFAGYLGYGIASWIALQAIINIGVSVGLLPTKGLTLPFISYGGNSLLACCMAIGLIFRIDFENRSLT